MIAKTLRTAIVAQASLDINRIRTTLALACLSVLTGCMTVAQRLN